MDIGTENDRKIRILEVEVKLLRREIKQLRKDLDDLEHNTEAALKHG